MERIRLASDCTIYPIDKNTDLSSFCCGDTDLDEFFRNDAYNRHETIEFYQKNGFRFLYSDEILEKEAFHIDASQTLNTRMMYLDLIDFVSLKN